MPNFGTFLESFDPNDFPDHWVLPATPEDAQRSAEDWIDAILKNHYLDLGPSEKADKINELGQRFIDHARSRGRDEIAVAYEEVLRARDEAGYSPTPQDAEPDRPSVWYDAEAGVTWFKLETTPDVAPAWPLPKTAEEARRVAKQFVDVNMAAASKGLVGKHINDASRHYSDVAKHVLEVGVLLARHARDNGRPDIASVYEEVLAQEVAPHVL